MKWVLIVPVSERGCYPPHEYEKHDDLAYKALQIHAMYVEQFLDVEVKLTEDAYPDRIVEVLSQTESNVLAFGHGYDYLITANDCKPWLNSRQELPEWVKDRVFIFVACLTGKELCPELVKHGAKAAFGLQYVGIVIFFKGMKYCRFLYAPLIGMLEAAIAIQYGFEPQEAAKKAIERWENEIHYWANFFYHEKIKTEYGDYPVDEDAAQLLMTVMTHNKNAFVAYYPATPTTQPRPTAKHVAMALAALAVVFALTYVLEQHPFGTKS